MAWLQNLTLGRKVVVKGDFDEKTQNKGGFILF